MFGIPTVAEVEEVARSLGLRLTPAEAESYQQAVVSQLELFDDFVQARLDEDVPPIVCPERAPGRRPSPDEDPLNAWLWKCVVGDDREGLLQGKTVGFKDTIAVAGMPLTFHSYAMDGFIADTDATIVTRVLEAGGTVLGKNSLEGLVGSYWMGDGRNDYQRPLNPHRPSHVAGGSSSGGTVAVVAGEVDIAFGGDQGGSIRVPAAWSGAVGLKPTFGLVSHFGVGTGADQSVDYVGPIARTPEDVALALQAVAGYDGLDPRQDRYVPERLDVTSGLHDGVDGLRIGLLAEGFREPIQPEVRAAVSAAVDVLAAAGAKVSTVSVPAHDRTDAAMTALFIEGSHALFRSGYYGTQARTYYPTSLVVAVNKLMRHELALLRAVKLSYIVAEFSRRNYHGAVYAKAHNVRPGFVRAYDAALADVDVLVMPTCLSVAPEYVPPSERVSEGDPDYMADLMSGSDAREWSDLSVAERAIRNQMQFNYTGHPALTVPCGKADGLPIGMQLVGRCFDDGLLLRVAAAYEQLVDWDELVGVTRPQ